MLPRALLMVVVSLALCLQACGGGGANNGGTNTPTVPPDPPVVNQFDITFTSPDVGVHQGYATDGKVHFLFDTGMVERRADDANWTLQAQNAKVFTNLTGYDHLGDGDYYNGKLYVAGEYYKDCSNFAQASVFVFDAQTLDRLSVTPLGEQFEISGVAVDPVAQELWVSSFCDATKIRVYDLAAMTLKRTVLLQPNVPHVQGIALGPDGFYLSKHEGTLWRMSLEGQTQAVFQLATPVAHEGLDYSQSQLRWLIDGGTGNKKIYYLTPK